MFRDDGGWVCRVCDKWSKNKYHIVDHIEAKHIDTGGFSCVQCGRMFKTRDTLRRHGSCCKRLMAAAAAAAASTQLVKIEPMTITPNEF